MNRLCTATLFLSLTLVVGCQPKTAVEEDIPDPTIVTPEPPSPSPPSPPATTDERKTPEPVAPEGSSTSTADPATDSTPGAVTEKTPDGSETSDAVVEVEEEVTEEVVEEETPPTEQDFMQQIDAAMQAKNVDVALEITEQAQAAFPDSKRWLSIRSQLLFHAGRMKEGMDLLKEAHQKDPENGQLASQILQMGLALADRSEGEAKHKATVDVVAFLDQLEEAGRLETLGRLKERIVEIVRFSEAKSHATQGDLDAAKQALQTAFASGFRDVERLRDDEAFVELLQREDVAQMVVAREEEIRQQYLVEAREELDAGETFPFDFSLEDITGERVALEDFAGKVVIVDFWGTWCPPCRKEIPLFIKLKESYGDDLAIVGINYEHGEDEEANIKLIKDFDESLSVGLNYPCCLGDDATQDQVPNLRGFPTTLFLDRSGKVRMTTVGFRPYGKLNAIVSLLVEEKPAETTDDATAEEPTAEEPVAEDPATEEPVAEEPATEEPVAEEPAESIEG